MAILYNELAKNFPGLKGEELDIEIFHHDDFQTKMRASEEMFKSVISFTKFKSFGEVICSLLIITHHPIIKELMEFEKSKLFDEGAKQGSTKPKKGGGGKSGGKKGGKGVAKGVANPLESKTFIETCEDLLNVLELFNMEENLKDPQCQIRIREKMVSIILRRLKGKTLSPNIFEFRMKQVWSHIYYCKRTHDSFACPYRRGGKIGKLGYIFIHPRIPTN